MAQSGFTPIQLYFSTTAAATPSAGNLANGELAINITDGRLFYKDNGGTVRVLAGTGGSGVVAGSNTQVQFNNNGVFGASANMTFNGTRLTVADLADSGLTAGRVVYVGSGSALVDSAALTFDGTNLGVGGSVNSGGTLFSSGGSGITSNGIGMWFNTSTNQGNIRAFQGGVDWRDIIYNAKAQIWQTTDVEQMRLTSTGLGIGTSSPAYKLDVSGVIRSTGNSDLPSSAGTNALYAGGFNSPYSGQIFIGDGSGWSYAISRRSGGVNTPLFIFQDSGNLGLGVTPSAWASSYKAYQVSTTASFHGANDNRAAMASNYVETASGGRYINSDFASAYVQVQSQHRWFTAPSGTAGSAISFTQAMTLDASGNLGVGTTSPGQKLDIRSDTSGTSVRVSTSDNGNIVRMGWKTGVSFLAAEGYNSPVLAFETGGSERARIDSSGNLLVGVASQPWGAFKQAVYSTNLATTINGVAVVNAANSTGGYYIGFVNYLAGFAGFISQTGVSTVNYATTSDYRLKENIAPMTGALAKVIALKPVTYTWKSDGSNGQGFIAHELQEVVPECVTGNKDEVDDDGKPKYQGIDTSFLVATLTAAIQEQQALIQTLTARVAALESN